MFEGCKAILYNHARTFLASMCKKCDYAPMGSDQIDITGMKAALTETNIVLEAVIAGIEAIDGLNTVPSIQLRTLDWLATQGIEALEKLCAVISAKNAPE